MVEPNDFRFTLAGRRVNIAHPAFGALEVEISEESAALVRSMDAAQLRLFAEELQRAIWETDEADQRDAIRKVLPA